MSDRLEHPLRWVLVRHLASVAVILVAVGALAVVVAGRIAGSEAADHAEIDARTLAAEYVVPLTIGDLREDSEDVRGQLDAAFAARLERDEIRSITIWEPAGRTLARVLYSDRDELVGRTFDLGAEATLFGTEDATAHRVGPGDYPGDPYPEGTYEAYVGFSDGSGASYVFEAYLPTPQMAMSRAALLQDWLPLVVGSLVVLGLATAGLAARLARQVAAIEADRRALIGSALRAGEDERMRLAQRLHDGVLQDLSGAGLALDSIGAGLDGPRRDLIDEVAGLVRRDVGQLRSLGEELFSSATADDLVTVVRQAVRETVTGELDVDVDVESATPASLDAETARVVQDVVREAVRNVVRHAHARHVWVVARAGEEIQVEVRDDGRGFAVAPAVPGHLGLRLVDHAAQSVGGRLEIASTEGRGTSVTLVVPTR